MSAKTITLGHGFSLPIDTITEKIAILAQSGAGKTTVGVGGFAENLLGLKQQVVVLDPKGDWWGIRSSRDGKGAGFPVTVFGGLHGDLPIYPESGPTVANLIVREGISAVLDVSDFESDGQRHKFTTEFALAFYKAKQRSKSPVLFVIEEADESCPQQMIEATEARMVGAIKRIAKLGRFCGIGVLIISQRAADVNKKILSQASILIVMRTWHATDLKAIGSALKDQVSKDVYDEVMAGLPSLETGEGFVIAPKFGIKKKVKFYDRNSFDAGETPKVGAAKREAKVLAPVEIEALKASMAAEVEKAKAENPKELLAKIRTLEKELAQRPDVKPEIKEVRVEVVQEVIPKELLRFVQEARALPFEAVNAAIDRIAQAPRQVAKPLVQVRAGGSQATVMVHPQGNHLSSRPPRAADKRMPNGILGVPEKRILTVLAQRPEGCEVSRIAILAGYTVNGHFNNVMGKLRADGYITPARVVPIQITQEGLQALGPYEPLPTGKALQDWWLSRLTQPEGRILSVLLESYPTPLDVDDLAAKAGYTVNGHFNNIMGSLRGKGLISAARLPIRASDDFFEER